MADAPPVANTPKRLLDDSVEHPSPLKKLNISLGQPESEKDSDEEASLDVTIDKSNYYPDYGFGPFFELMEVYSVIINRLEGNQLYGDIRITARGSRDVVFFHHEKSSSDDTTTTIFTNYRNEHELLLTDPGQSILMDAYRLQVSMEFTNDVNNKTTYKCYIPFCKDGLGTEYNYYDRLISATLSHKAFGSITMNYTVFQTAVAAKVEVELLDTDISIDDVYGFIYAYSSAHELEICLFHKTKKPPGAICGTPHNGKLSIPLSRSIVALPYDADLMFNLDLRDSKTENSIVKTYNMSLTVPPTLSKPRQFTSPMIRFPNCVHVSDKIQINVTWASRFEKR